jgi:FMN phosphatase YigB (HAD superfamily)
LAENSIRAIVFDIGKVIVHFDVGRAAEVLGRPAGLSTQQVFERVQSDPKLRDFQEGRLSPQDWHAYLAAQLHFSFSFEEFRTIWCSALDPTPILEEELFRELSARFRLALLSNTDPLHVAHLESRYAFLWHFPARIYSCGVGMSKPRPEIYAHAAQQAGAAPRETLYVDDIPEYVEAGRRAGLEALHFTGRGPLLDELRHRGLLA